MKLLAAVLLAMCSGCAQLLRLQGDAFYNPPSTPVYAHPYKCTKVAWEYWTCAPFRLFSKRSPLELVVPDALFSCVWPFSLVEVPVDAVVDTVAAPADMLLRRERE